MKQNKNFKPISVTIDKTINDLLENNSINKSKLINKLIKQHKNK